MKKYFLIVLCIVFILPYFYLFSNAVVTQVNSVLTEPVPVWEPVGNGVHVKTYAVVTDIQGSDTFSSSDVILLEYDYTLSYIPTNCYMYVNYYIGIWQTGSFTESVVGTLSVYNVVDGSLIYSNSLSNRNEWGNAILPSLGFYPQSSHLSAYFIQPEQFLSPRSGTQGTIVDPFVNWASVPLSVNHYKSFVSEPVADDLNRYFILAGEDNQYLFAVRYYIQDFEYLHRLIYPDGSGYVFNDTYLVGFIAPYLLLDNSGLHLSLYCDPDLYLLATQLQDTFTLSYNIHIAQYDLETGQYISSYVFDDINYSDNEIPLNISLGSADDYDSVQVYGVYYRDDSTNLHYNLLACTWALDPDFIAWRNSVTDYLQRIYEVLSQQGEDVTIDADMSAIDEGQSAKDALKVTDAQGSEVDAAQQVEVAFSEAAQGFGDLSDSVTGINGLIQRMFFQYPIVLLPVIVALALGLLVTILGKNKSD